MLPISEFSRISGLSIKALRLYHEQGLLVPKQIDPETNYRYYDFDNVETARVIQLLRQMMIPLDQIKNLLQNGQDDKDAVSFLEHHKTALENKMRELKLAQQSLQKVIEKEKIATALISKQMFNIEEKHLESFEMAGIKHIGRYDEIGKLFVKLGRSVGSAINGKGFGLYYDQEFKEEGAEFECCFPIKKIKKVAEGISVRILSGGSCVSLVHQGSYDQIFRSYAKLLNYVNEKDYQPLSPSREVYLKGPGMIFKGNPQNYLTEIQFIVKK